jgi:hypothetical protein
MTTALLALLLFASMTAIGFALRRRWTSVNLYRLEPEDGAGVREEPGQVDASTAENVSYPPVAIIVPARDEEDHLEGALASLAALDYPAYRVIVVDDGSTDGTAAIAERYSERWDRFQCIAAGERKAGWGGKTWALECGLRECTEPWVLFTDADVIHHPASLARATEHAQKSGAALVSVVPRFVCESFWERLLMPAFLLVVSNRFPPDRVRDPRSRVAAASGGFLLVRRELLERTGGLEPVRGRVAEDIAIARRIKRSGERISISYTRSLLTTRMYSSLGQIAEGLGKHAHEGMFDSTPILLAAVIGSWVVTVLPFATLLGLGIITPILGLPPISGPLPQSHGVACAIAAASYIGMKRVYEEWVDFLGVPFGFSWGYPLAGFVYGLIALRAAAERLFFGGPRWKGRRIGRD